MSFGDMLSEIKGVTGLTNEGLADVMGVTLKTFEKWMYNFCTPTANRYIKAKLATLTSAKLSDIKREQVLEIINQYEETFK